MFIRSTLLAATTLAFALGALAAPVTSFAPASVARAIDTTVQPDASGVILVQQRARGGGGGGQRAAAGANRGGNFNSNNFHRDASNTRNAANISANRNVSANRNTNVNANRNVNVSGGGGCCYGSYDSGPNWGGVAAGVAVGALVGAAANSATQPPPPTYPPGYVAPPPY